MNIALVFFSGTNSTFILSKELTKKLKELSNDVTMVSVEAILKEKVEIDFKNFDMLGFVLPIYGGGEPHIIFDVVDMLPRNKESVFIIRTAASFGYFNQSASIRLKNKLREKWYDVFYERIVVLTSNFLLDFDDELIKKLYEVTINRKVPAIVKDINAKKRRLPKRDFIRYVITAVGYYLFDKIGRKRYGKSLYANKDCTKCKLCERRCPTSNIDFKSGSFNSGSNCAWCMRCVYECPKNAIHSRGMDFVAFKTGYNYLRIVNDKSIGNKKFQVSRKFWKYINNDNK